MVLSLAACGAKEEAPAETQAAAAPEAPAADEKVEVTMIAAEYGGETAAWWADFVAKFNAAKAEWADVKQGVIAVQQEVLLGGNAQELLDALQAEIAG